jgi:hypothetical protein
MPTDPPEKFSLSASQVIASGLAAASATVAASYFGVAGTVIGAALASVVTVTGNAVYGYSLRRTHRRVRQSLDVAVGQRFSVDRDAVFAATARAGADRGGTEGADAGRAAGHGTGPLRGVRRSRTAWAPKRLALAAAGLFLVILAATTGFELVSGQPLSSTVTGKHGSGLSIGGGTSKQAAPSTRPPAPASTTASHSGSGSPTPTVTVTVTPSSQSPSVTSSTSAPVSATSFPTPTGSAEPSTTPTPTPTG